MKFADYRIPSEVVRQLDNMNFKRPTDIQYKTIPHILEGEDVLAIAQTGTGKTAAFAIPLISMLHEKKIRERRPDGVKCIVLVPTHELAEQLTSVFKEIGALTKVITMGIYGGVDQEPQIAQLEKRADIVIATPGRMFDLISQGHFRTHRVEVLVLDEADHMLDMGFIDDIYDLRRKLPKRRQTLFFSATINKKIKKIAYTIINQRAIRIQFSPKNPVAKNVEHSVMFIKMEDKRFFLEQFIQENPDSKTLVFVRTRVRAERVKKAMERVGISTITIHGDKTQEERTAALKNFKSGNETVLIATDVSARGIDIPDIKFVINYDLPDQAENYVHRVGRTGRGKNKGDAFSFCSPGEVEMLEEIQESLGKEIEVIPISSHDYNTTKLFTGNEDQSWEKLIEKEIELSASTKKRKKKKK